MRPLGIVWLVGASTMPRLWLPPFAGIARIGPGRRRRLHKWRGIVPTGAHTRRDR